MIEKDYIAKRRAATKRLNAGIRAMLEFAEAAAEVERICRIANMRKEVVGCVKSMQL